MNVYALVHAFEPKVKIGKANDVHERIRCLGEPADFNLEDSLCVALPSEADAYRVEKIVQRAFEKWNLPYDPKNRYDGDTEQFDIACFPRVRRFLTDITDLLDGALPGPLPPVPERIAAPKLTRAQRQEQRENAARRRQEAEDKYRIMALAALSCGIDQICQMNLEVLVKTDAYFPFITFETPDRERAERALAIMWDLQMLMWSPEHPPLTRTYVFRDVYGGWIEKLQKWVGIGILERRESPNGPMPDEYLEILDRIPTVQRRLIDHSEIQEEARCFTEWRRS